MTIPHKPKIIAALLLSVFIMNALSYFFFIRIDNIVNVDLYNYGLMFNSSWADRYQFNAKIYLFSATFAAIFFASSIAFFLAYNRSSKNLWGIICSFLLVLGSVLSFLGAYFFYTLEFIVNHDLYFYGLRFDSGWFAEYSLYDKTAISLVILVPLQGWCRLR
jgi:hypothetical protein